MLQCMELASDSVEGVMVFACAGLSWWWTSSDN